ncbi:MAG: iron-containing redox enzyme family protein [Methylosarcina sp.]
MTTEFHHPFAPSQRPDFSSDAYRAAQPYRRLDDRELFYTLMHISEHYAVYPVIYDFIRNRLAAANPADANSISDFHSREQLFTRPIDPLFPDGTPPLSDEDLGHCVLQVSPVILTEPCWLNSISQAATSRNPLAVELMMAYLELTRKETSRDLFLALLLATGREALPLTSRAFSKQEAIGDSLFEFAAIQLAFTCFPRVFFPEILGFTAAYCRSPVLLESFQPRNSHQNLALFLETGRRQKNAVIPALNKIIEDYVHAFSDQTADIWRRIQSGFRLYRTYAERCHLHLFQQVVNPPSFGLQLAKLLEDKAAAAASHHGRIKLQGRSLNDWFAQSPFDSANFLAALADSSYIDKENPAESPLLKLFDFNGPMFGVLNSAERNILKNWLISEKTEIPSALPVTEQAVPRHRTEDEQVSPKIDFSKLNNRELYYYLVNAELFPEVLATAKKKVRKVLRSAGLFRRLPFKTYSHQAFEDYIDILYRREVERYRPLESTPKLSKEAYLWGIEQFAPAILVDGCWLQAVSQLKYDSNRALAALLFKIYEDETGNGILEQNHPYIYRQLLNSINLSLPAVASREFIQYPGFIDSSFDLPVYLLSISKFPSAFLPELLGLNMAIELSGLGNVYLRLSKEMTYWGLNPSIVDVHISIDNVASGHAFLAKKAIQLYLDEILAVSGIEVAQTHWRRIYDGYCSLQSVCRGFKFALVWCYLLKQIKK